MLQGLHALLFLAFKVKFSFRGNGVFVWGHVVEVRAPRYQVAV